tara:strand:- start:126 stop:998 length:873 start_codon:yes stop_codon:yes gene_type:complete
MKGIILAGGAGSRLYPSTLVLSKQLIPVYDKPMIYYSLSVLMLAKINDILIISTPVDIDNYKKLLGNGASLGINLSYTIQEDPNGLAEAFILGEEFIKDNNVCLILGDNIFYGQGFSEKLINAKKNLKGAKIFGYKVKNPQEFGVIEFDNSKSVVNIEEKPKNPKSNYAVTGLYFYDNKVVGYAKSLKPSNRGELEITDLNNMYLKKDKLDCELFGRGFAWLDTGTHESLLEASQFIHTIEKRQGLKVACLEEISLNNNWINKKNLEKIIRSLKSSDYKKYLVHLLEVDI